MAIFIITYSLKKPGRDITSLVKGLGSFPKSLKCFDNVWLIGSEDKASDIYLKLKPFFDEDKDHFLIMEFKGSYYGWMPTSTWEWISENSKS